MRKQSLRRTIRLLGLGLVAGAVGCGFNPAFLNTFVGGQVPVTPGPAAAFVFVRCVNETGVPVEFILTVQKDVLVLDDEGQFQVDESNQFITRPESETVRLTTAANGDAAELGTVFDCSESPVTHVGLGRELLPTDTALFVAGQGAGGAAGFGIQAGDLNPLLLADGNFNCGDTIIFRAFLASGVAGGVDIQAFLLPGSEQPSIFSGPSTFETLQRLIESQVREDEQ